MCRHDPVVMLFAPLRTPAVVPPNSIFDNRAIGAVGLQPEGPRATLFDLRRGDVSQPMTREGHHS